MAWYIEYLILYLCVVNIIGVALTIYDKIAAKKSKWRVSEKTLIIFAVIGSGVSMYITMHIIRHKTKHPKFMIGIPIIVALELVIGALIFIWVNRNV